MHSRNVAKKNVSKFVNSVHINKKIDFSLKTFENSLKIIQNLNSNDSSMIQIPSIT